MSRKTLLLVGLIAVAGFGLWGGLRIWTRAQEVVIAEEDRYPPGRWRRQPALTEADTDPEAMARVLSLPYAAGKLEADGIVGVMRNDAERAFAGLNFYVSGHGPEAILIDMSGVLVHRWRYAFEDAFPERTPTSETSFWRRAILLPDGGVVAIFQGGGLIRLDRSSRLLWSHADGYYNDILVTEEGHFLGITKRARSIPEIHPDEPVLEDSIIELDGDGQLVQQISLLAALQDSPFFETLQVAGKSGDILHTNTLQLLDGSLEAIWPHYRAGNILFSLREPDTIGILDPDTETVVWAIQGPWKRQHEPVVLDDGAILLFDNQGSDAGARVLELAMPQAELRWSYTGEEGETLWSPEAGTCARLPNGNTLITESERGRAIEVAPDGAVVWEFRTPHRAGSSGELVASLLEVVRVPPGDFQR